MAVKTTDNIDDAKAYPFPHGMRALAGDAQRLLDAKTIDAYAIKTNGRGENVMGVRTNGKDWAYLA